MQQSAGQPGFLTTETETCLIGFANANDLEVPEDTDTPAISRIISISHKLNPFKGFAFIDQTNCAVKFMFMYRTLYEIRPYEHESVIQASFRFSDRRKPLDLALLSDGLVAVTDGEVISLLSLKGPGLIRVTDRLLDGNDLITVESRINCRENAERMGEWRLNTSKLYQRVGGLKDGNLIVSGIRPSGGGVRPGERYVGIINRQGDLIRTVIDSNTGSLPLEWVVWELHVLGAHVFLTDKLKNAVYKVDIASGALVETVTHSEMKSEFRTAVDSSGRLYLACFWTRSVLVRSTTGQWKRLLQAPDYGALSRVSSLDTYRPMALCVTNNGEMVVSWDQSMMCQLYIYRMIPAEDIKTSPSKPSTDQSSTAQSSKPSTAQSSKPSTAQPKKDNSDTTGVSWVKKKGFLL